MSAKTARYLEIEQWLRRRCVTNPPGTPLPAETELAEQFSVSRMTARHAFENLTREGLIDRRRGVGSFVAAPPLHRAESVLYSFTDDMNRRGMVASSRLLSAEIGSAPRSAVALGLDADAWVVKIDRVRLADGQPLAREQVRLPSAFKRVLDYDLENGSLHAALADMGRVLGRATGHVVARLATSEEAKLLELAQPAALLVEVRVVVDRDGQPVEYTETAYVGSRWVIDTGPYVHPASGSAAPIAPAHAPSAPATMR